MGRSGFIEFLLKLAPAAMEWGLMLLPVAVYLLYLAYAVHRRRHPTVRTGVRNTLELALAASGFLLLGPPTWLLSGLQIHGRQLYFLSYAIYLILLLWLLARACRRSRAALVLFNLSPFDVAPLLEAALKDGPTHRRQANGRISFPDEKTELLLEVAPWWRCCTLRFQGPTDTVRLNFEPKLRAVAATWPSGESIVGSVLTLAGGFLLFVALYAALLFSWYLATFDN